MQKLMPQQRIQPKLIFANEYVAFCGTENP
jgi:hypothetical protein